MNPEKTTFKKSIHIDGSYFFLVNFEPGEEAVDILDFENEDGGLARVFVGSNEEPIAIRFRGVDAQGNQSEHKNPLELSREILKATCRFYCLAVFLVELHKGKHGKKTFDRIANPKNIGAIMVSDDITDVTERIIDGSPRETLLCAAG